MRYNVINFPWFGNLILQCVRADAKENQQARAAVNAEKRRVYNGDPTAEEKADLKRLHDFVSRVEDKVRANISICHTFGGLNSCGYLFLQIISLGGSVPVKGASPSVQVPVAVAVPIAVAVPVAAAVPVQVPAAAAAGAEIARLETEKQNAIAAENYSKAGQLSKKVSRGPQALSSSSASTFAHALEHT